MLEGQRVKLFDGTSVKVKEGGLDSYWEDEESGPEFCAGVCIGLVGLSLNHQRVSDDPWIRDVYKNDEVILTIPQRREVYAHILSTQLKREMGEPPRRRRGSMILFMNDQVRYDQRQPPAMAPVSTYDMAMMFCTTTRTPIFTNKNSGNRVRSFTQIIDPRRNQSIEHWVKDKLGML